MAFCYLLEKFWKITLKLDLSKKNLKFPFKSSNSYYVIKIQLLSLKNVCALNQEDANKPAWEESVVPPNSSFQFSILIVILDL